MFSSKYVAQKLQQHTERQGLRHLLCDPFFGNLFPGCRAFAGPLCGLAPRQLMGVRLDHVTEIRHHHGARIDQRVAHGLRLDSLVRIDPDRSHAKRWILVGNPGKASEHLTKIDRECLFRIAFRRGQRDPRQESAVADRCHEDAEPGVVRRLSGDTPDPSNRWTVRSFSRRVELP